MNYTKSISKRIFVLITISVLIAYVVSLIPQAGFVSDTYNISVFKHDKTYYLSQGNLVDFIALFSTEMQIKRVTWEDNSLAIDFNISNNVNTDLIYKELFTIIKDSYVNTTNIDEVLIRIFLSENENLFLAISSNKQDINANQRMELESPNGYKQFLDKYFGLNYGKLIKQD